MGTDAFYHGGQVKPGAVSFRNDGANYIFPDDIFFAVVKKILSVGVEENYPAFGVHAHNDAVGTLNEFAIATLALAKGGLSNVSL